MAEQFGQQRGTHVQLTIHDEAVNIPGGLWERAREVAVAASGKSGIDRIQVENEEALVNAVADKIGSQALPGIFAGGKEIVHTVVQDNYIEFRFNDESRLVIEGEFTVRFAEKVDPDVLDSAQAGRELMSGDFELVEGEVIGEEDG